MSPELWNRIPPEAQAIFLQMAETIARLERRVADLEARLNKTPRNSSLPPSSEHPHGKPAPQKRVSGKKPGGQPGHAKYERALVPVEHCAHVVPSSPRPAAAVANRWLALIRSRCGTRSGKSPKSNPW